MRIVVNDIAASSGGALTVLKEFYNCVRENDQENEWIFLLGDHLLEETENIQIKVLKDVKASGWKKLYFDFIAGKKYITGLKPDVAISLQNIITFGLKVPQVVYIHQSIPFQKIKKFSYLKRRERKLAVYQHIIGRIIKLSAKKSQKVIVQTRWMREAVCDACHLPPDKVVNVMPNVKSVTLRADEKSFQKQQFFYPARDAIYKNIKTLLQASDCLTRQACPHKVILTLAPEKSRGNVICAGNISYEQVLEHYTSSTLVFPSYMESFGYPLAEARMVGTIVLAADTPFARELLDGYPNARFFDPFRPEELAALMKAVATGEIARVSAPEMQSAQPDSWLTVLNELRKVGV